MESARPGRLIALMTGLVAALPNARLTSAIRIARRFIYLNVPGVDWIVLSAFTGRYGGHDYVIFAVLLFYILTIAGLFVLCCTRLDPAAGLFGILPLLHKLNHPWQGLITVLVGLPVYFTWRRKATI